MPCSSTSQLTNASTVPVMQTMPQNQAQWSIFAAQLQGVLSAIANAANKTGVNVLPSAYALYDSAALPSMSISGATASLDSSTVQFGNASLKLVATAATVSVSFTGFPVPITPFQRWIVSVFAQSSRSAIAGTLAVVTPETSYPVNIDGNLLAGTWGRLYGDCALTADDSSGCTVTLTLTGCSVGDTFHFDGWQLEQANGTTDLPSAFVCSGAPASQDALPDGSTYVRLDGSHAAGNVAYNYRGVWAAGVPYVTGDETVYSGTYWLATAGSTGSAPGSSGAPWQAVGAYNDFTGAWSATTAYLPGQEVTYAGNFWVCALANTNSAPTTSNANWAMAGPQSLQNIADGTSRFASINDPAYQTTQNSNVTQNSSNNPLVINPYFSTGDLTGWTMDHAGVWAYASGSNGPSTSTSYAQRTGSSANPTGALRNLQQIPVYAGAQLKSQCAINGYGSPNGTCGVRISWRDRTDTEISTTAGNTTTGNGTNGSYVVGTAPSGAMFAHVECAAIGHTTGYYTVDNFWASAIADSLLQVPDGSGRYAVTNGAGLNAVASVDANQRALIDFAQATHLNKNLDNIPWGTTYASLMQRSRNAASVTIPNAQFQQGLAQWTQFGTGSVYMESASPAPAIGTQYAVVYATTTTQCYIQNALAFAVKPGDSVSVGGLVDAASGVTSEVSVNFANASSYISTLAASTSASAWTEVEASGVVPAGATYAYLTCNQTSAGYGLFNDVWLTINDLRVAGSGTQIGDQRNLLPITFGGVRSVLSASPITYTITSGSPTSSVVFSVAAVSLYAGSVTINYAASSASHTQTNGTTANWFVYYIDPTMSGGSLPLQATANPNGPAQTNGAVLLGVCTVTVASGGGGSGGSGSGGGGYCVADDMFIRPGLRAGDAAIGDAFDCIDLPTQAGKHVRTLRGVSRGIEECVRLVTDDGCALTCSLSTPFDTLDGRTVTAARMLGERVVTDLHDDALVVSTALVGPRPVTRAHLGGVSYAAGSCPTRRIYSHNVGTEKP